MCVCVARYLTVRGGRIRKTGEKTRRFSIIICNYTRGVHGDAVKSRLRLYYTGDGKYSKNARARLSTVAARTTRRKKKKKN